MPPPTLNSEEPLWVETVGACRRAVVLVIVLWGVSPRTPVSRGFIRGDIQVGR